MVGLFLAGPFEAFRTIIDQFLMQSFLDDVSQPDTLDR
jgi:hypothetical protein